LTYKKNNSVEPLAKNECHNRNILNYKKDIETSGILWMKKIASKQALETWT
jgi:hypothetical protein